MTTSSLTWFALCLAVCAGCGDPDGGTWAKGRVQLELDGTTSGFHFKEETKVDDAPVALEADCVGSEELGCARMEMRLLGGRDGNDDRMQSFGLWVADVPGCQIPRRTDGTALVARATVAAANVDAAESSEFESEVMACTTWDVREEGDVAVTFDCTLTHASTGRTARFSGDLVMGGCDDAREFGVDHAGFHGGPRFGH